MFASSFRTPVSSGSFPNVDWTLTANESNNGGLNKFSIDDSTNNKTPFTILANAPSNSLYINAAGKVGFGTASPNMRVEVVDGNSPAIRLNQDGSDGFTAQSWDIAGNETNFFIRDVTHSSKIPFKIVPGAPTDSFYIAADGDLGVGTKSPDGVLDIAHPSSSNNHALLVDPIGRVGVNVDNGQTPYGLFDVQTSGGVSRLTVDTDGDVGVGTASPTGRLDVRDTNNSTSYFNVSSTGKVGFNTNNVVDQGGITTYAQFDGGSADHMGVTLNSIGSSYTSTLTFAKAGAFNWLLQSTNDFNSGSADRFVFYNNGANEVLSLQQDRKVGFGGVSSVNAAYAIEHANGAHLTTGGVWTNASSRSLKDNIIELTSDEAADTLEGLNPVTYSYKVQPEETYVGFIAEEVPDTVAQNDRKSLSSMDIVAVLTKVVKDQQATIKTLNERLEKLESAK